MVIIFASSGLATSLPRISAPKNTARSRAVETIAPSGFNPPNVSHETYTWLRAFLDGVVEAQAALSDQLHHGHRDEGLRDAPDPRAVGRLCHAARLDVRESRRGDVADAVLLEEGDDGRHVALRDDAVRRLLELALQGDAKVARTASARMRTRRLRVERADRYAATLSALRSHHFASVSRKTTPS